MQIDVSQIIGEKGAQMPFQLSENMINTEGYPDVVDFLEPVTIEGTFTNLNNIIVLEAKGAVTLKMLCDRCLAPVKVKVNFKLNEKFKCTGSDGEEIETFFGDCIVLTDIVRRSLLLALPMKVVCQEACKGLCTVCGKDLNEGDCNCDTTSIDPRFESLRSLFNVDEEV